MFNTLCQLLTQCMSGSKRLTATVPSNVGEALDKAEEESFDSRTRAEREAVKRGLQDMGHLEAPEEPHQKLLWVVNRVGLGLGLVGLLAVGFGILAREFRRSWASASHLVACYCSSLRPLSTRTPTASGVTCYEPTGRPA